MNEQEALTAERQEVVRIARRMTADGLVVGTSGNVSMRRDDRVAVTPSGVDYADLTAEDVPVVALDGSVLAGGLKPTSELAMHLAAYREHQVGAVVHTHSLHATALSLLRDEVPAVHYQLAEFGGAVPVCEYATFGSDALARSVSEGLRASAGCILRNHGTVTVGARPAQAYDRARQLEWMCQLWLTASGAGQPRLLDETDLARAAEQFTSYGQPAER